MNRFIHITIKLSTHARKFRDSSVEYLSVTKPWQHFVITKVFYYVVIPYLFAYNTAVATGGVMVVDKCMNKHWLSYNN